MIPGAKRCPKCGKVKTCDKFYKERSRRDGRRAVCILCDKTHRDSTKGKEVHRKASAKHRKLHPQKEKARNIVSNALRAGWMVKEPCHCGEMEVQAHHEDYNKPLDVEWLCVLCHNKLREKAN